MILLKKLRAAVVPAFNLYNLRCVYVSCGSHWGVGGGGWGGGSLRLFAVVVIEAVANDLLEILRIAKTYTFHSNQTLSRLRDVFMKIIKSTIPVKVD